MSFFVFIIDRLVTAIDWAFDFSLRALFQVFIVLKVGHLVSAVTLDDGTVLYVFYKQIIAAVAFLLLACRAVFVKSPFLDAAGAVVLPASLTL